MTKMVYVDPKLIAGETLRYAVFVKELDGRWVLQSAAPETRNVDKNVTFMKTKSGRWVDFV